MRHCATAEMTLQPDWQSLYTLARVECQQFLPWIAPEYNLLQNSCEEQQYHTCLLSAYVTKKFPLPTAAGHDQRLTVKGFFFNT